MVNIGDESKELTQSQSRLLFDNVDHIISHTAGELEASDAQRQLSVFFDNGVLVIAKNAKWDPQIISLRSLIRRRGYQILEEVSIEPAMIRALYDQKQEADLSTSDTVPGAPKRARIKIDDVTPMQKELIKILAHGVSLHASDIHINVNYSGAGARMRVDGDMVDMYSMPTKFAHELLAAAYNMADNADASYRVLEYQAARISSRKTPLPSGLQGVRLQYNPLESGGRYLIARLLYAEDVDTQNIDVDSLGFHGSHIDAFVRMRARPEGVNFISGPTGSGKSTTLKVALEAVYRDRERKINIITIEDPPEYTITGAYQLPVTNTDTEEEKGAAFRRAISAALRSDPDVVMPGEARDRNVINLVFTAAMTGHQVWTSIHTNSAIAIFDRVRDQGVEPYKLYDPDLITGLLAQRLLRQLCPKCKITLKEALTRAKAGSIVIRKTTLNSLVLLAKNYLNSIYFVNNKGCDNCRRGYKGRSVVAEIITPDHEFMRLMSEYKKKDALQYWRNHLNGMNMIEHAYLKMISGAVDPRDLESRLGPLALIDKDRIQTILKLEEKYKDGDI